MRHRITPPLILLLAFAALTSNVRAASLPAKPNILLILADDLGVETLGSYGGTSYPTPHLDQLAREGIRFQHCYSMPVCHPTRTTLLTGRYPFRLGNPAWGSFPQAEEANTLGNIMRKAGYQTAVAGKWQLALLKNDPTHPQRMGFHVSSLFGWHEGPRYYDPMIYHNGKVRTDTKGRYGPDLYVEALIDFMRENRNRPFWAFYSMALCHDVTDDLDKPVPFGPMGRYQSYPEMVEAMDTRVGRLVEALDHLELRERTLVLFVGDNGSPKNPILGVDQDGKFIRRRVVSQANGKSVPAGKGELTDGGTHVPLIANWPGVIAPGQLADELVDFSDFLPTFAELAGATPPPAVQLDGQSFAPRLRGETGSGRKWVFAQQGNRHWVRSQRWKLYDDHRIFDLSADADETESLRNKPMTRDTATAVLLLTRALHQLKP